MVYITDGLNTARILVGRLSDKDVLAQDETSRFIPTEDEILTEAYFKGEKVLAIYKLLRLKSHYLSGDGMKAESTLTKRTRLSGPILLKPYHFSKIYGIMDT